RHPHAAHGALARRRHHVEAIGGGAVAADLTVNAPAARFGVFELLQHQHARPASNYETITISVVSARRLLRRLIEARGHGAHGVEQYCKSPVELLASAS